MIKKTIIKGLWLTGGILFLLIGLVCLALPVVPQLIFFVASIFCFMKSSERFHQWVHQQHWFERIKKHLPRRRKR